MNFQQILGQAVFLSVSESCSLWFESKQSFRLRIRMHWSAPVLFAAPRAPARGATFLRPAPPAPLRPGPPCHLVLALLPRVRNRARSRRSVDPLVEGLESVHLDCRAASHPPRERESVGVGARTGRDREGAVPPPRLPYPSPPPLFTHHSTELGER